MNIVYQEIIPSSNSSTSAHGEIPQMYNTQLKIDIPALDTILHHMQMCIEISLVKPEKLIGI